VLIAAELYTTRLVSLQYFTNCKQTISNKNVMRQFILEKVTKIILQYYRLTEQIVGQVEF